MNRVKRMDPLGGEHGVSCVFHTLQDIINFEENKVTLDRGYPRFINHPYITALNHAFGNNFSLPVISGKAARYLLDNYSNLDNITIKEFPEFALVIANNEADYRTIHNDVRNAGLTLSSRKAKRILEKDNTAFSHELNTRLTQKLASLEIGSRADLIRIFPSGMVALYALFAETFSSNKSHVIMIGSPYVDTRKLLENIPTRNNLPSTSFILGEKNLAEHITPNTGLIYIEMPSNPLLGLADIDKVVKVARDFNIPVAIDATIASPFNLHPFELGVDLIMHSTTKFLNGKNNHLGGALFINPKSQFNLMPKIDHFIKATDCQADPEENLLLLENLSGFRKRMEIINANALEVAKYLDRHTKVNKFFYPGLKSHPDYKIAKKQLKPGYSGVMSFFLKNSNLEQARNFYDNCTLSGKGPSLGAEQTLLCPITMLSFYHDNDETLKKIGQDRYTMRISVGIESPTEIIRHLENGFKAISN